jgi:uncharacterized protein CbrC (UPF0167 family)
VPTFRDLGIDFPLYEAPVDTCSHLRGEGACGVCGERGWLFGLEAEGRPVDACSRCFRAGRALRVHDTELGMVTPELARAGVTHGVPGDVELPSGLATSAVPGEEDWVRVHVPAPLPEELVRTPTYSSWQGSVWLFCCARPMVFVGEKKGPDVVAMSGGADPLETIRRWVGERDFPTRLFTRFLAGETDLGGLYTFRCAVCGTHRAGWDMD